MVILTLLVLELLVLPLVAEPPVVLLLEVAFPELDDWLVELFTETLFVLVTVVDVVLTIDTELLLPYPVPPMVMLSAAAVPKPIKLMSPSEATPKMSLLTSELPEMVEKMFAIN